MGGEGVGRASGEKEIQEGEEGVAGGVEAMACGKEGLLFRLRGRKFSWERELRPQVLTEST